MLEIALARTHHDYTLSSRNERQRSQPRAVPRKSGKASFMAKYMTSRNLMIAVFCALTAGFLTNALGLQKARHPAPLFVPAQAPVVAPVADMAAPTTAFEPPVPLPMPRPVDLGIAPQPAPVKSIISTRPATSAHTPGMVDQIAMLLRPHVAPTLTDVPKTEPSKTVFATQRALVKLGFVLKPDGVFGGTTRQAIERFERDQGMPVKGEMTPKIIRLLASQSGIASE